MKVLSSTATVAAYSFIFQAEIYDKVSSYRLNYCIAQTCRTCWKGRRKVQVCFDPKFFNCVRCMRAWALFEQHLTRKLRLKTRTIINVNDRTNMMRNFVVDVSHKRRWFEDDDDDYERHSLPFVLSRLCRVISRDNLDN